MKKNILKSLRLLFKSCIKMQFFNICMIPTLCKGLLHCKGDFFVGLTLNSNQLIIIIYFI